ncbi:hypothetical protein CSUB01_10711 [Colletotrichum sublineola]|uniref:BCL5p n=1 Tax=Colletotrichum sublineola TaxID=1173701 RepID=A0A066X2P2_COLSU|nr:hypothetical protein CSUB01_10711 [Colletotrichum sublineola]
MSSRAPQRVLPDLVVPVDGFDKNPVFGPFVMSVVFVYDSQLDTEKVYDALVRVVMGDVGWRKVSGRLRNNDRGELEYHIPQSFSEGRKAITSVRVDCSDMTLAEKLAENLDESKDGLKKDGLKIPRPPSDDQPAIVGDPDEIIKRIGAPKMPERREDYLLFDISLLGADFVSFKDSTVLVLHWPHTAFDLMALSSVQKAWSLALEGKDHEIPKALPPSSYPLENLGKTPSEPHVLADRQMSLFDIVLWGLRNFYRLAICKTEHRIVCVPKKFLEGLVAEAEKEDARVTPGDVLVSWVTHLTLPESKRHSKRLVCVQQACDWRSDILESQVPLLRNCVGFLVTLMPIGDVLTKPVGYLASAIRRSIREQRTKVQIEAYSSLMRKALITMMPPFFGNSSMRLLMFSNWTRANLYDFDLSAAAIPAQDRDKPLFPYYVQTAQTPHNFPDGNIIVGRDKEGNFWLSGFKQKKEWKAMEQKMKEFARTMGLAKHELYPRSTPPGYGTSLDIISQTFAVVGVAVATWRLGRFFAWY